MLERLSTCLCHPKRVGMFFKDKIAYAWYFVGAFYLLAIGIAAIICYSTDNFNYNTVDAVVMTATILDLNEGEDVVLDCNTKALSGKPIASIKNGVAVYFLRTGSLVYGNDLTYDFRSDYVAVYNRTFLLGRVNYSDIDIDMNISLSNVIKSDKDTLSEFRYLIDTVNDRVNTGMSTINFLDVILNVAIEYIIIVVVAFISTRILNPTLDAKMRLKLCLYATLIYFVFLIFSFMFLASWIRYIAFFVSEIYALIALFHIRKVSKK